MRPRGIPRGKHRSLLVVTEVGGREPSMRPRGIPRGKLENASGSNASAPTFNEAAGNTPRKTTEGKTYSAQTLDPSMRPRGIPRGKHRLGSVESQELNPFNEAAGNTPRKTRGAAR